MSPNEITNKNENMSSLQLNNTELIFLGNRRYELNVTDQTASIFAKITPLHETQTMYFMQEAKQCSVQLKNSLDELRKAVPEDPNLFLDHFPAILPKDIPRGIAVEEVYRFGAAIKPPMAGQTVEAE